MDFLDFVPAAGISSMVWNILVYAAVYVTLGIGLMKMAQKLGLPYPWLSWIPLANMFLLVRITGQKKRNLGIVFLVLMFIALAFQIYRMVVTAAAWLDFGLLPGISGFTDLFHINWGLVALHGTLSFLGGGAGIAAYVLWCILLFHIFRRFKPRNRTVFTVLSVIFWFLGPIFILAASFGTPDQAQPPAAGAPGAEGSGAPPQSGPQDPPSFTPPSAS